MVFKGMAFSLREHFPEIEVVLRLLKVIYGTEIVLELIWCFLLEKDKGATGIGGGNSSERF